MARAREKTLNDENKEVKREGRTVNKQVGRDRETEGGAA